MRRGFFALRGSPIALTSSSTLAQVQAEYEDNCGYDVEASVAKCKLFIVACRYLLRRNPNEVAKGTGRVRIEPQAIQAELEKAEAWLETNDADSTAGAQGYVRHASFARYRT